MSIEQEKSVTLGIKPLVDIMNSNFGDLDGHYKAALLRTVATYFESIVASEATEAMIKTMFNKL